MGNRLPDGPVVTPASSRIIAAAGVLAALCLLALTVIVVRQNLQLKDEVQQVRNARVSQLQITIGTKVTEFNAFGRDGAVISLTYGHDSRPTLLMVFSTTCGFCDINWPQWEGLRSKYDNNSVRLVWLNLGSSMSSSLLQSRHLESALLLNGPDPSAVVTYDFRLTPQTLVIDESAVVRGVWSGVLDATQLNEIAERISEVRAGT
jgi:thiol-disulfide isomerase/thioredoxin